MKRRSNQGITYIHQSNALDPIVTTDDGIMIYLSDVFLINAKPSIDCNYEGNEISVNESICKIALLHIRITANGIEIDVNE